MCEIVTRLCADLKQLNRWIEIILLYSLFALLNFTQNQIKLACEKTPGKVQFFK
jgi:hypothetical protein